MEKNHKKPIERPYVEDVEKYFSEFVEFYGGKIIEKLTINLTDRPNADYLFEFPEIIAELKCFRKDIFSADSDFPKIQGLLEKWTRNKMISQEQLLDTIFRGKPLPEKCITEIVSLASKTIERAIHKANKQIATSKETLNKQYAKGVIFLINDGNYFFSTAGMLGIICNIIGRKFKNASFDVVVYLTINQVTRKDSSELDYTHWIPIYTRIDEHGETVEDVPLFNFVNDIGYKFGNDFFILKSGQVPLESTQIEDIEQGLEEITDHYFLPKKFVYKK